ncbi:type II toxin-antitoxin system Phd/YefM family antitoxin [Hoyosella altamirensis]|uniref:Prevent-host-death family protein n=1 Tax=Hoyosella altamirensis TaxID=616997 RepID=A0A839RLD6_9ACTN|nr:type II toxin-antitoxin system prevent-host-death family antitoxin [Hoyosella altamirensis]MBB3037099.1 prevent-host-death family protein [Hoyosella altamirensis]
MESVSVRELRNHGGAVLDRVARGESLRVTRDGAEVAEIRPSPRRAARPAALIASRKHLPRIDFHLMRVEIDELIDAEL